MQATLRIPREQPPIDGDHLSFAVDAANDVLLDTCLRIQRTDQRHTSADCVQGCKHHIVGDYWRQAKAVPETTGVRRKRSCDFRPSVLGPLDRAIGCVEGLNGASCGRVYDAAEYSRWSKRRIAQQRHSP